MQPAERGSIGHDQIHTGGNKAVGDGSAGSGIALCILEIEGDVLAEGSGQGILKALRSGIQSGMLHQLADADRELLAIGGAAEEAAAEDAEEPPQAVRAAAAPQAAAAARNERRVILRIMIISSIFHCGQQDAAPESRY